MENLSKNWHLEIAQAARLTPNLIPDDIVFQFKRRQPFKFHKKPTVRIQHIDKPPIAHTRIEKQFRIRSETNCRSRPSSNCSYIRDSSSDSRRNSEHTNKIEKMSLKLLQEIDSIIGKENNLRNVFTPCEYSNEDKQEVCQDFKDLSRQISKINKGRAPLSNLRVELKRIS